MNYCACLEFAYSLKSWINTKSPRLPDLHPGAQSNLITCFRAEPLMQLFSNILVDRVTVQLYSYLWTPRGLRQSPVETWRVLVTAPSWPKFCEGGLCDITASGAWQNGSMPVATHKIIPQQTRTRATLARMPTLRPLPHPLPSQASGRAFGNVSDKQRGLPVGKGLLVRWWQVSGRRGKIKHHSDRPLLPTPPKTPQTFLCCQLVSINPSARV